MAPASPEQQALTDEVKNTIGAEQSAIVLIDGFAQRLADAGSDPAALTALQTDLATNRAALAAAVVANNPAA